MPARAETATKRCKSQTESKATQNPDDETSSHNPRGGSLIKPTTKDVTKNERNEKRRTATPSIANRISHPTGPKLLARINQNHNEPLPEPETITSHP
ncbi:hypothetical protein PGT21_020319 [Puccinia graminis f. sp. tritici]|uniref:Uncharacterized protein n=1 Tax=Puccinia graminis f. sp. tritici TaxID=56615 RepID=A0A5B0MNH9_PUCGR|nr:hypothetical protein PGT21_020319 [Puccinia graminis f. sp. tritici]